MDGMLSQDEINALLSGMDAPGGSESAESTTPARRQQATNSMIIF